VHEAFFRFQARGDTLRQSVQHLPRGAWRAVGQVLHGSVRLLPRAWLASLDHGPPNGSLVFTLCCLSSFLLGRDNRVR
jgi:hypothetical protein